jgi:hypothetical protein
MAGLVQARTRNGYDLTRHDQSLLANGPQRLDPERQLHPDGLMVIAAAAPSYQQPPDRRARSNQ